MASLSEPKATFKRDFLRQIENQIQERWANERVFETDAPKTAAAAEGETGGNEKFMAAFPYPYMNGRLHLGHCFSLSKAEFAAGFERLLGKKVLFPFAFHCTGMPIKAAADKLCKEIKTFGCPPAFPESNGGAAVAGDAAKHSKVAAKTGNAKYQWQIMESVGIPSEEIPNFADPQYWIKYFPPVAQSDLKAFGLHVDWRRSFITTDANPYYDSFIRWQFNKLRKQDKIRFGKRYTIFSPLDGQPCMDHDRASGEGVEPKEYVCIKLQVVASELERVPVLASLAGSTVSLIAATLRPETMYGQTNCWVGPDIEYGAFRITPTDVFICTARAATNLAHQGFSPVEGKIERLASFKGSDLINLKLRAPLSIYEHIHVLPMLSVSANMGTGIVTSVPSNSPDDFATLRDFREKEAFRRKYNINDQSILPFVPVALIHCDALGDFSAEAICTKLGVRSQNDRDLLDKAKEACYKEDFYGGVMLVGAHAGRPVAEAKPLIRAEMIDRGEAFVYYEPDGLVISRSGDECVVSLVDQWFIAYGEEAWRADAERCLAGMNCYSAEVKHQFEATFAWMRQWACSRSFGLGSKLPWDKQYLIESLSDSTIYMAYYTVAHILQAEGSYDGAVSANNIKPEQMTDEVWDYVFGDDAAVMPDDSGIPRELLERMRREFRFFYPLDLRVSGKDLIPNHLTFFIYNHVALFPEQFWPKGIRANGHLLLNSQKMSKSTGNFMTMREAVDEFTADATRIALADAGDGIEDANFLRDTANSGLLRLYTNLEFFRQVVDTASADAGLFREDEVVEGDGSSERALSVFQDRVFDSEINRAIISSEAAYRAANYRDVLKYAFYELQNARDRYRDTTTIHGTIKMNRGLMRRYVMVQSLIMAPITPHLSDHVWTDILAHTSSIMHALWPLAGPVDEALLAADVYLQRVAHDLRLALQSEQSSAGKKGKPSKAPAAPVAEKTPITAADIFVATAYPKWQEKCIAVLKSLYNADTHTFSPDDQIVAAVNQSVKPGLPIRTVKKLVPFVMELKKRVLAAPAAPINAKGESVADRVTSRQLPFDETAVLRENMDFLTKSLGLLSINVVPVAVGEEERVTNGAADSVEDVSALKQEAAIPGEPTAFFHA